MIDVKWSEYELLFVGVERYPVWLEVMVLAVKKVVGVKRKSSVARDGLGAYVVFVSASAVSLGVVDSGFVNSPARENKD